MKKNEAKKHATPATKSMAGDASGTKLRNETVMTVTKIAIKNAIKRGLNDIKIEF